MTTTTPSAPKTPKMTLALPKPPATAKVMRFTQSIKDAETQDKLNSYMLAYKEANGVSIDRNTLVELMLQEFMSKDKEFMKFFGKLSKEPDARAARAVQAAAQSTATDDGPAAD